MRYARVLYFCLATLAGVECNFTLMLVEEQFAAGINNSSDAATRLFLIPGVLYASRPSVGNLLSSRTKFSIVVSIGSFGWMIDFGGVCCRRCLASAFVLRRDILAPVLMIAVVFKLSGLSQPGRGTE